MCAEGWKAPMRAILPYGSVQWEKLSIFLTLLIPKLPKPEGEDYTEGLLEDVVV